MRLAIHAHSEPAHPDLHHHVVWTISAFALVVMLLLLSALVAADATVTTSGTIKYLR